MDCKFKQCSTELFSAEYDSNTDSDEKDCRFGQSYLFVAKCHNLVHQKGPLVLNQLAETLNSNPNKCFCFQAPMTIFATLGES